MFTVNLQKTASKNKNTLENKKDKFTLSKKKDSSLLFELKENLKLKNNAVIIKLGAILTMQ